MTDFSRSALRWAIATLNSLGQMLESVEGPLAEIEKSHRQPSAQELATYSAQLDQFNRSASVHGDLLDKTVKDCLHERPSDTVSALQACQRDLRALQGSSLTRSSV